MDSDTPLTMIILIVYIAFATVCLQSQGQPTCEKIERAENFNLSRYAQGVWYEIGRANNNWESRGDCVILTHTKQDKNTIIFKIATVVAHKAYNVEGVIEMDSAANGTGYVDYYSKAYQASEGTNVVPVEIMAIDYDKYAVVFHCHFDDKEKKMHSYIWIMARSSKLDDASKKIVLDTIKKWHVFNVNEITWDHFSNEICHIVA